jgi:hypothetical protein
MKSLPITTKVHSDRFPPNGHMYSMQLYVIYLRQFDGYIRVFMILFTNKSDDYNITDML